MRKTSLKTAQAKIKDMVEKEFGGNKARAARHFKCSPSMINFVINEQQPLTETMQIELGFTKKHIHKSIFYS